MARLPDGAGSARSVRRSPSTRLSFDGASDRRTPIARSSASHASSSWGEPSPTSSISSSRHSTSLDTGLSATPCTRSSASSATSAPPSVSVQRRRRVTSFATGFSTSPRVWTRVRATRRAGGFVPGAAQRHSQLVTGVGVDRELEVPARVVPADAAPQREPGPRQPQVGGVEVGRVQLELVLRSDGETEQLRRIGQLELRRGLVLAFRLAHPSPHALWLPSEGRTENGRVKGAHSGH